MWVVCEFMTIVNMWKLCLASNILVHQTCDCQSPLQYMCAGSRGVTYLLGDTDLLEEESTDLTYTCNEWKKMAGSGGGRGG